MAAPDQYVDWQVLTTGGYEFDDLAVFEELSRQMTARRPLALDIGANVGHHMFVFATLGWRVMAFEPNPSLWPSIKEKIRTASLEDVSLHGIGLGDQDLSLRFRVPISENSGTGQFVTSSNVRRDHTDQDLPVRRGDDYLVEQKVENVDVIKIDIQGFEATALRGLRSTLESNRPVLCIEIGDENREEIPSLDALAALLPQGYGFRMMRQDPHLLFRLSKLVKVRPTEFGDIDGNIFCVPEERIAALDRAFQ
ncbi:MAG: FkbM family methyltransferase [Hyphomicrobium sp.]